MIYNYHKNSKGFSLVEMLVAVSLLLIVIVGPITVTSRAAKSASFATEQTQAFFLAQEGIELAEKARDDLLLGYFATPRFVATPWTNFFNNSGTFQHCYVAGCGLEWGATAGSLAAVVNCSPVSSCLLRLRDAAVAGRSRYNYSSGSNTIYTRVISFSRLGTSAVRVTSTVTWKTGALISSQKVTVETYLYNTHVTP